MLIENIRNVSVIAFTLKKAECLNIKLVKNPKKSPMLRETAPSMKN